MASKPTGIGGRKVGAGVLKPSEPLRVSVGQKRVGASALKPSRQVGVGKKTS